MVYSQEFKKSAYITNTYKSIQNKTKKKERRKNNEHMYTRNCLETGSIQIQGMSGNQMSYRL